MFDCVLIHYGELGLKGLNRPFFEKKLIENIEKSLAGQAYGKIRKFRGRIVLELELKSNEDKIRGALKKVFGIAWFAFCYTTDAKLQAIENSVGEKFELQAGTRIRVSARRADKTLQFTSMDVNRELGSYLVERFKVRVSLKEPQEEIFVELAENKAYIFNKRFKGLYGLPVGVSGRVLHLLSGGLDSPVAAWLLMKRGCQVQYLHFHACRKFDEEKNAKILRLVEMLTQYSYKSRVFFVPFYPILYESVDAQSRYRLIIFRRFMFRVAERIANKYKIKALGSGENLAQVSSQTLENIAVVSKATSLPILRPLISFEKNDIVSVAKQIGTFALSTLPYKDCCSLFMAKHPVTEAKLETVKAIEKRLNLNLAINETLQELQIIDVPRAL